MLVDFCKISPVCSSRAKQVRTHCLDMWVSSLKVSEEVIIWPFFMVIPLHLLSSKLAFKSRWRNSLTMFVSPYHSQSRKRRNILIHPSSIVLVVVNVIDIITLETHPGHIFSAFELLERGSYRTLRQSTLNSEFARVAHQFATLHVKSPPSPILGVGSQQEMEIKFSGIHIVVPLPFTERLCQYNACFHNATFLLFGFRERGA